MSTDGSIDGKEAVPILEPDTVLRSRFDALAKHFRSCFDREPAFFVRVPGRVNLIGEHIDYCGYAVCPMAIEQDVLLAVAGTKESDICLTNFDSKYERFQCDIKDVGLELKRTNGGPAWHKYFLCGVKGGLNRTLKEHASIGMLVAVWGNIPASSGLASSSALVSGALLATMHVIEHRASRENIASYSAIAEWDIGTRGGGMDQAIAFLGKPGSAKFIEFNPLRTTDVTLPESAVFVIAHSLVSHNKAATDRYNLRVAECQLAAEIITKQRNEKRIHRLIDIQTRLGVSLEEMITVVTTDLHEEPYTVDEILGILEMTRKDFDTSLKTVFETSQTFKLRQRALHVFQEASRVQAFCKISEDRTTDEEDRVRQLGILMSESHASLKKLYECSHPNVDELVDVAIDCGALGARLTGAGWGGCIVAIITKNKVSEFMKNLKEKFYDNRDPNESTIEDPVFLAKPSLGAVIYTI